MKSYGKFVLSLIAGWFVIALSASALDLFKNDASRLGIAVALAALAPVAAFALWFFSSEKFRTFALLLNPRTLTLVHSWRVLGFVFVVLWALGVLPAMFALPAGLGDTAVGATATFVAWRLTDSTHRKIFVLWQALGVTDLVSAVALGVTAGLVSTHGASMGAMTALPLSLVPTFFVPLLLILHSISIAQASAWKSAAGNTIQAADADPGLLSGGLQSPRRA